MSLDISDLIMLGMAEDKAFDKHRRHLIHKESSEGLLAFKLDIIATLGLLELHASPKNSVAVWYAQKLAGLLTIVEDEILQRTESWR